MLDDRLGGRDISEVLAMPVSGAEEFFGARGRRARPPPARSFGGLGTGGSATSPSATRSRRCLTAISSGASSPRTGPKRAVSTCPMSRPPVFTSPTSSSCWAARPSCRLREIRGRHRAPPGDDGARRLDIDVGSGAGHDGGRIVFAGKPADLVGCLLDPYGPASRGVRPRRVRWPRTAQEAGRPVPHHAQPGSRQ